MDLYSILMRSLVSKSYSAILMLKLSVKELYFMWNASYMFSVNLLPGVVAASQDILQLTALSALNQELLELDSSLLVIMRNN